MPKPGRPKTSSPRTVVLHVRVTEEQAEQCRALAAADGRPLSQWVAQVLSSRRPSPPQFAVGTTSYSGVRWAPACQKCGQWHPDGGFCGVIQGYPEGRSK